jgi:predicted DNA-binding protein with PD1-like motif
MQRITQLVLMTVFAGVLAAGQVTKVEKTMIAPNPADDKKGLSASVPDVYAVSTQFERVVVLRFKNQTDVLAGLEKMVKEQKIKNGVILSALGSLISYHVHAVSNRTFPSKDVYFADPTAPSDLLSMNGYVIGGRIHAHVTLSTGDKAFGGHLEPGTKVFTFVVVTIGVLKDAPLLDNNLDNKSYR